MSKAVGAALLSGLVFPGVGYLAVKRPRRALALMVLAGGCLLFVLVSLMQPVGMLMQKAMSGEMPLDVVEISAQVHAALAGSEATSRGWAVYLLLACWIFSIVDGYRIGRAQDLTAEAAVPEVPTRGG